MPPRVAALAIYPVKACHATPLDQATLGRHGLAGDREWMVVRPDGRFLTQRTHPQLARICPALVDGGLDLVAEGLEPLRVPQPVPGRSIATDVEVWDDRVAALDAGDEAGAWLSSALGIPTRLVRVQDDHQRRSPREWVGEHDVPVAFADRFPILVCSTASLAALNEHLPTPVPMDRFRPNLVVDGLDPFAEDGLRFLRVGECELELVKPCTRCSVPGVDQERGVAAEDPFPALRKLRWNAELRGVTFGVNAVLRGPRAARLDLGMAVAAR
jgi:hypothetical protein